MKRKDREVSDFKEIIKILVKSEYCTLSLCNDNIPYAVIVNFVFEVTENNEVIVYIHGAKEGMKIDFIKKNNKAFFSAVGSYEHYEKASKIPYITSLYESVTAYGEIEFIEKEEEKVRIMSMLMNRFSNKYTINDFPKARVINTCVLKMKLNNLVGKHSVKPETTV